MRLLAAVCAFLFILCGCGAPRGPLAPLPDAPAESFWRFEVGRGGELFSGIMLLKRSGSGYAAAILDPSGVTLASLRVDSGGAVTVNDGLPRTRGLARLAGRAVLRIFVEDGRGTGRGCRAGGGFFRGYEVCAGPGRITLDNPWPEPDLALERIR